MQFPLTDHLILCYCIDVLNSCLKTYIIGKEANEYEKKVRVDMALVVGYGLGNRRVLGSLISDDGVHATEQINVRLAASECATRLDSSQNMGLGPRAPVLRYLRRAVHK